MAVSTLQRLKDFLSATANNAGSTISNAAQSVGNEVSQRVQNLSNYRQLANSDNLANFKLGNQASAQQFGQQQLPSFLNFPAQQLTTAGAGARDILNSQNPIISTARGIGSGTIQAGTFGLTQPLVKGVNPYERAGSVAGEVVGAAGMLLSPFAGVRAPNIFTGAETIGQGATKIATRLIPTLARDSTAVAKVLPIVGGELTQAGVTAAIGNLGGKGADFKTNLAQGLALQTIFHSPAAAKYIKNGINQIEALGIKGVSPNAFRIGPEDEQVMGNFIQAVRKGGKEADLGQVGIDAQNMAEHYLGKNWATVTNEKLAKAFEYLIDTKNKIPEISRAASSTLGQIPTANIVGETKGRIRVKPTMEVPTIPEVPVSTETKLLTAGERTYSNAKEARKMIGEPGVTKITYKPKTTELKGVEKAFTVGPDGTVMPPKLNKTQQKILKDKVLQGEYQVPNVDELSQKAQRSPFMQALANVTRSSRNILQSMGDSGKALAGKVDEYYNVYRLSAGKQINEYLSAIKGVSDQSLEKVLRNIGGQDVSLTPNELPLKERIKSILSNVAKQATDKNLSITRADGTVVPFVPRENYIPNMVDYTKLKALRSEAIDHMVRTGQMDLERATQLIDEMIKSKDAGAAFKKVFPGSINSKYGHLEASRVFDMLPDVLRYDKKMIADYLEGASRRIARATVFGNNDEAINGFLQGVQKEGGDLKLATDLVSANFHGSANSASDQVLQAVRTYQSAKALTTGFITNLSQSVNTGTTFGVAKTLNTMAEYITNPKARAEMQNLSRSGILDASIRDLQETSLGTQSGWINKITAPFFKRTEVFNRVIAGNTAKAYVLDNLQRLIRNANDATALKGLKTLGLSAEDIANGVKNGGFSEDILQKAALKGIDLTQFKVDPIDLPPGWQTGVGKTLAQFKQFSFKQTEFVWNQIGKELANGNPLPLVRYLGLAVIAGEITNDIKSTIRNKQRPSDIKDRMVENFTSAGGGGLPLDLAKQLIDSKKYGKTLPETLTAYVLGPSVGQATSILTAVEKSSSAQDIQPIVKEAVKATPLVGSIAAAWIFPSQNAIVGGQSGSDIGTSGSGKTFTSGKTMEDVKRQKSDIAKALDQGKKLSPAELDFYYNYNADKMPSDSSYAQSLKQDQYIKNFQKVLNDETLSQADKQEVLGRIAAKAGVSKEDLFYYDVASKNEEARMAFLDDRTKNLKTREEFLQVLLSGRTEVNGKMFLSNGMVDTLYENGTISLGEAKALKKISGKSGQPYSSKRPSSGSGRTKAPKIAIKKVSLPKGVLKIKTRKKPTTIARIKTIKAPKQDISGLIAKLRIK